MGLAFGPSKCPVRSGIRAMGSWWKVYGDNLVTGLQMQDSFAVAGASLTQGIEACWTSWLHLSGFRGDWDRREASEGGRIENAGRIGSAGRFQNAGRIRKAGGSQRGGKCIAGRMGKGRLARPGGLGLGWGWRLWWITTCLMFGGLSGVRVDHLWYADILF